MLEVMNKLYKVVLNVSNEAIILIAALGYLNFSEAEVTAMVLVYCAILTFSLLALLKTVRPDHLQNDLQNTKNINVLIALCLVWFMLIFFMSAAASVESHISVAWDQVFSPVTIVIISMAMFGVLRLHYRSQHTTLHTIYLSEIARVWIGFVVSALLLLFSGLPLIPAIAVLFFVLCIHEIVATTFF